MTLGGFFTWLIVFGIAALVVEVLTTIEERRCDRDD